VTGRSERPEIRSFAQATASARALMTSGRRRILGIVGAPGAGKSTLAAALVRELGPETALVPMDGFHLAQTELERLGRAERKGAPDTFDTAGYIALLRRLLAAGHGEVVYAPRFSRDLEESIAGAIPVAPAVTLVVTEGNYLLLDTGAWVDVRELLDEAWFITVPDEDRLERLVARHLAGGRSPAEAQVWAHGSDERNTELVAATADAADRSVSAGVVAEVHRRVMEDWAP
jgi:pantothenate kinase